MKPSKELLNLYLLKVLSSICDNNKPLYSLLNQWSRLKAASAIFDPKLKQKGAAYTQVFTVTAHCHTFAANLYRTREFFSLMSCSRTPLGYSSKL